MIQLRSDCLLIAHGGGAAIPCSADEITLELVGAAASTLDPSILKQAAAAVLHYFRDELGRETVTAPEFAAALGRALAGFGLAVEVSDVKTESKSAANSKPGAPQPHDLRVLACDAGKLGELAFFPRLHAELVQGLNEPARWVEFRGLRPAVKQLLGRKHWTNGCRELEERIITTLRQWWEVHGASSGRALIIR